MISHSLVLRILIGGWFFSILTASGQRPPDFEVKLMTFNLRYASEQPPNAWSDRRPVMRNLIQNYAPDVLGTQEGLFAQIQDLDYDLPDYDWVGLGRQGGSRGEFCAIFYRHAQFELVAFDHFWLSDTPEVIGSITWGHQHRRMATWVKLRDRETQAEFIVLNTHFDHRVEKARVNSATLIRDRISSFDPSIPLVVMGDFNCVAESSEPFRILTTDTGLIDTFKFGPFEMMTNRSTFHGYEKDYASHRRIDWILARRPADGSEAYIVRYQENGQYPSDHFPVTATVGFYQ